MSASADWIPAPFSGDRAAQIDLPLYNGNARPLKPRELKRAQLKRADVFMFFSPKENRRVTLVGPLQLAFRLQLEFDPTVTAVVERPRSLAVGDAAVELHFWWSKRNGHEHYALVVPDDRNVAGP